MQAASNWPIYYSLRKAHFQKWKSSFGLNDAGDQKLVKVNSNVDFHLSCQVVRDAPWEYDEEFLEKHKIDFVAHDDIPYTTEDCEDTYAMIKAKDMFVATQRTEGKDDP